MNTVKVHPKLSQELVQCITAIAKQEKKSFQDTLERLVLVGLGEFNSSRLKVCGYHITHLPLCVQVGEYAFSVGVGVGPSDSGYVPE